MTRRPPEESRHETPLPGAVMPLAEEHNLVRRVIEAVNDNWSMRRKKRRLVSDKHYSDDDDHDQTIPI